MNKEETEYNASVEQRKKDAKKIMKNSNQSMNEGTYKIGEVVGNATPKLKDQK